MLDSPNAIDPLPRGCGATEGFLHPQKALTMSHPRTLSLLLLLIGPAALLAGCGGGGGGGSRPTAARGTPPAAVGSVTGKIVDLSGTPVPPAVLLVDGVQAGPTPSRRASPVSSAAASFGAGRLPAGRRLGRLPHHHAPRPPTGTPAAPRSSFSAAASWRATPTSSSRRQPSRPPSHGQVNGSGGRTWAARRSSCASRSPCPRATRTGTPRCRLHHFQRHFEMYNVPTHERRRLDAHLHRRRRLPDPLAHHDRPGLRQRRPVEPDVHRRHDHDPDHLHPARPQRRQRRADADAEPGASVHPAEHPLGLTAHAASGSGHRPRAPAADLRRHPPPPFAGLRQPARRRPRRRPGPQPHRPAARHVQQLRHRDRPVLLPARRHGRRSPTPSAARSTASRSTTTRAAPRAASPPTSSCRTRWRTSTTTPTSAAARSTPWTRPTTSRWTARPPTTPAPICLQSLGGLQHRVRLAAVLREPDAAE